MCEICQSFKHKHSSYKRWQAKHLAELEDELSDMPTHTRAQKNDKAILSSKITIYKGGDFDASNEPINKTCSEAVMCIQCEPPIDFDGTGLTRLRCANGTCDDCGVIQRPTAEMNCEKLIRWYEYKVLPHCTECGPLEFGKSKCETCLKQKTRKKLVNSQRGSI